MLNVNQIPVGAIKTFGYDGIPYQVEGFRQQLPNGDILVDIVLLESGQKEQYKLSQLLTDPEAR